MRIALISRWYWEENRRYGQDGGPVRQLAEAVAALGHEIVVLTQSPVRRVQKEKIGALDAWITPRDKRRDLITGLRDKFAKKAFKHRKIHTDALALGEFLAKAGPFDVIWAQTESPDGLVVGFAAQQLRIPMPPVLVQVQALRYRFSKGTPIFIDKEPLGLAFRQATRIIANSEMIAGSLHNFGVSPDDYELKVRVVYPNLHRTFLQAAQQDPLDSKPMKDRVLFLGALNQGKGALLFLRALPKTEVSKRSSVFAVIGDFTENNPGFEKAWEETKETTRIQTLGARIEYLGHVSPYEVIRQIRLARVVVIPSLFDAFSRALVESLVLGRPVITTDRVGAWPLVQAHQCGVVVPANDTHSLAHAIDVVLSPIVPFAENAAKLSARMAHEFSPEAIALQISYHLSRITGASPEAAHFGIQTPDQAPEPMPEAIDQLPETIEQESEKTPEPSEENDW